jgi:hypothetical protein
METAMKTPLVILSAVLATAAFGAASDVGSAGLALALFLVAVAAGIALSFAREDWIASPSH